MQHNDFPSIPLGENYLSLAPGALNIAGLLSGRYTEKGQNDPQVPFSNCQAKQIGQYPKQERPLRKIYLF